jgi:hypothetical protein
MGKLQTLAECIQKSTGRFQMDALSLVLNEFYDTFSIAIFCTEIYSLNPSIKPFYTNILEATECYFLGKNKASILTLIPTIEGIIRNLGKLIGFTIENEVGISHLIKVLKKIQEFDIKHNIFTEYNWFPKLEMNVDYFDKFHERIQLIGSVIYYLEQSLYVSTKHYNKTSKLNRHGVVHAFIAEYDDPTNFLRLITLINALALANNIVIGGSPMHPPASPSSQNLEKHFKECINRAASISYNKYNSDLNRSFIWQLITLKKDLIHIVNTCKGDELTIHYVIINFFFIFNLFTLDTFMLFPCMIKAQETIR